MDISKLIEDKGTWYPVEGSKAEILIKVATPKRTRDIMRRYSKKIKVKGTITEDWDWDQINCALLQETIKDWKGVEKEEGVALEVTEENKRLLFDIWIEFNALCNAVWDVSQKAEKAERAVDLGNSSTGQDSSLPEKTS